MSLALLSALALIAAGPPPEGPVPPLERTSARQAQADWSAVKAAGGAGAQLAGVAKKRLTRKVCDDLVDLRALTESGVLKGFAFRDKVRGRSWARPTMALVLSEAMKQFQRELPGRVIAIGDVSQPGCGQVAHGVLVQELEGDAAQRVLASARLELSEMTASEVRHARDFPWEADRFGPPDERVLVTTKLLGKDGKGDALRLRVARTRHRELPPPSPEEVAQLEAEVKRVARGAPVLSKKAESVDDAGVKTVLWVTHWIAPDAGRQLVLVTRKKPGRRIDFADVAELRLASWQDKKPGSFPDEVRWVVRQVTPLPIPPKKKSAPPTPAARCVFERWALMYEAGHISHLSGIDADLSYVTIGDTQHFAVDLPAMDVPATWRWLSIVEATARELKTPIDAVLIDASVKRHFETSMTPPTLRIARKSPAWRLLTLVGGHDAHHHLRIVEASEAQERAARKRLMTP